MILSVRCSFAALVAVTGVLACGGDSTAAVHPESLVIADGNGQSAPTGAQLAVPLRVTLIGSDGRAFVGAVVTWAVTSGAATLGAPTSTTDTAGDATVTVLLGGQIGAVSVRASVPGVTPAVFSLTVLDPCTYLVPFTLGSSVSATLTTSDCLAQGAYYTDYYSLTVPAQQGLSITHVSGAFDTWLDLFRVDGAYIAFNDDIELGVVTNSEIDVIVAPGTYVLAPNTFNSFTTGSYTISAFAQPQPLADCLPPWIMRGVTVSDSVTATGCVDTDTSGNYYSDAVAIIAQAGSKLTIAQRSTAVDAFVSLYQVLDTTLSFVASNDDSAGVGPNAFLVATAPAYAVYLIFAGTKGAGETGAYTLAVSSASVAGSAGAEARAMALPVAAMARLSKVNLFGRKPLPRGGRIN